MTDNRSIATTCTARVSRRALVLTAVSILATCLAIGEVAARSTYQTALFAKYPNAASALSGCVACHTNGNTSTLTPFGNDYSAAGHVFSAALEAKDSDGDGYTNVAELTASPATNPGNASSKPATVVSSDNYAGMWWASPAGSESGWGINFAHQGDTIFATWFTFGTDGNPLWMVAGATRTADKVYSGKLYTGTGPAFNSLPFDPNKVVSEEVGTITLTFADNNNAAFAYVVRGLSQTKQITREQFGVSMPTCTWHAQANLASATNYQDMWWASPAGSESGWGINFAHQGDTIFATWFTFGADGKPLWLVVGAPKVGTNTFTGTLNSVTGPAYSSVPFDPSKVAGTPVGTATFTFADGANATFAYTVNGVGQSKQITRQIFGPVGGGTICVAP